MNLIKEQKRACTLYIVGALDLTNFSVKINDDYVSVKIQNNELETGGFLNICNKKELIEAEINQEILEFSEIAIIEKFKGRIYIRAIVDGSIYTESFSNFNDYLAHLPEFDNKQKVKFEIVFTDLNDNIINVNPIFEDGESLRDILKTELFFARKNSN